MSISSVNPYMSMLAAYKTATADNKQSNTPLDTVESTQAKATTRPGDTVSISQEGLNQAKKEQNPEPDYPRPYTPTTSQAIFDKAIANLDENGRAVFEREKPIESILPENLKILEELRQMKTSGRSEVIDKQVDISMVMRYGDKEVFTSTEQVRTRNRDFWGAVELNMERMAKEVPTVTTMEGFAESLRSRGLSI